MKEERLFEALCDIDPVLLERSSSKKKRRVWPVIAAAACLALMLLVSPAFQRPEPAQPVPSNSGDASPAPNHDRPGLVSDPAPNTGVLTLNGQAVGQLHVCQLLYKQNAAPDFKINVNRELYTISENAGSYIIRPIVSPPDGMPPIDLTITHLDGVGVEAAAQSAADWLKETYAQSGEPAAALNGSVLRAGDGTAWDAAQAEVHIFPDEEDGSFVLTARYFTEAEEGHGVRFRDMIGTFQVIGNAKKPTWMEALYAVSERWMNAIFSDDMEAVQEPVELNGGFIMGYGEDVSKNISLAGVDYTVDDENDPASAVVSVRHRISTEDSYNYLTMDFSFQNGQWILNGAGIEK